jgi:hypothetical protein
MTQAQQARIAGFNASLAVRGLTVTIEGANPPRQFLALFEDITASLADFEVASEQVLACRLHILSTAEGLAEIKYGSVLTDDAGRRFRVTKREPHDIKTVFTCILDEAAT